MGGADGGGGGVRGGVGSGGLTVVG